MAAKKKTSKKDVSVEIGQVTPEAFGHVVENLMSLEVESAPEDVPTPPPYTNVKLRVEELVKDLKAAHASDPKHPGLTEAAQCLESALIWLNKE